MPTTFRVVTLATNASIEEGNNAICHIYRDGDKTGTNSCYVTWTSSRSPDDLPDEPNGNVTFFPGDATGEIYTPTNAIGGSQGTRTLTCTLSAPTGGATIPAAGATATVAVRDVGGLAVSALALTTRTATVIEGDDVVFRVTPSGSARGLRTFNWAMTTGTESDSNADLGAPELRTGVAQFDENATAFLELMVQTSFPNARTGARTITCTLSNPVPSNMTFTPATRTATLNNSTVTTPTLSVETMPNPEDEFPPFLNFSEGSSVTFRVTRSDVLNTACGCNWRVTTSGSHLLDLPAVREGTVAFTPTGPDFKEFSLALPERAGEQGPRTLTCTISAPTGGATLGTAASLAYLGDGLDTTPRPVFTLTTQTAVVREGQPVIFRVTRSEVTNTVCGYDWEIECVSPNDENWNVRDLPTTRTGTKAFTTTSGLTSDFQVTTRTPSGTQGDRTLTATISNPTGSASIYNNTAYAVLNETGPPVSLPVLALTTQTANLIEGDNVTFRVTPSGTATALRTFNWAMTTGTETESNTDLGAVGVRTGTAQFAANVTAFLDLTVATLFPNERNNARTITCTLSNPNPGTMTFNPGTRTAALNNRTVVVPTNPTGTATFAVNVQTVDITIPTVDRAGAQGRRAATMTISAATGATLKAGQTTAVVNLTDDAPAVLARLNVSPASGDTFEGTAIQFTITRDRTNNTACGCTWTCTTPATTSDLGTPRTGTQAFLAGDLTKTITVPTINRTGTEGRRNATLTISLPTNAELGATVSAVVVIKDNVVVVPTTPTLDVNALSGTIAEGSAANFEIVRGGNLNPVVGVDYAITTPLMSDLSTTGRTGHKDFAATETNKTFSVGTTVRATPGADRTITATLSNRTGGAEFVTGGSTATMTLRTAGAAPVYPSGLPWASSIWASQDIGTTKNGTSNQLIDKLVDFGTWRRRPCDFAQTFMGDDIWEHKVISPEGVTPKVYESVAANWGRLQSNYITNNNGILHKMMLKGWPICHAQNMLVGASGFKFKDCFEGDFDNYHQAAANTMGTWFRALPTPRPKFWFRLGWEASGDHFPSSFGNKANATEKSYYARAWRKIALIYKAQLPGLIMVWNHLSDRNYDYDYYYPGTDCVDVIGCDPYDNGYGGSHFAPPKTVANFNTWLGYNNDGNWRGARGVYLYAKSKGKQCSFDEWGPLNMTMYGNRNNRSRWRVDGSNNELYCRKMFDFFEEIANDKSFNPGGALSFEAMFNSPEWCRVYPKTSWLPLASDSYRAAWAP